MDNLQEIDPYTLRAGRATDRYIAEFVYHQRVQTDDQGELRVAGECGRDPTPGEIDVRELAIVPQYSREAILAEEAFVHALQRAGGTKANYTCCDPGGIYGDSDWALRDRASQKKLLSAPTKALMYCKAAILTLQQAEARAQAGAPA